MAVFRGFSVVLLGWAWATNAAAQSPRLLAEALGPDERVAVDGVLDEPVWARAQRTGGFVERRPVRGATPPVDTRFSVAYDEGALYFALICETDRPPRAFELTRDTFRIFDDDAISIKLDVRHDRRNTVGFVVNANGAQLDYVAVDNGRSFRREFDAVWEAETAVHEGEFIVEMRIPVPALGLAPAPGGRILGLEISRDHNARRATYDWAPIPVEFGAFSALHYGELEVPGALTGGRQFTLIPYVLGGLREDDPSRFPSGQPWATSAGVDARMRIGQDAWGEVTLLTDFAQVDLDDPAINLNRFPLFFPERRPFFLTGLDVFEFGAEGIAQPFFSRRIGLDQNRDEILMLGGAKVYGRIRTGEDTSLNVGLLQAVTEDGGVQGTSVGRLRLNFGEASYIGAISTLLLRGERRPAVTAGGDFLYRTGRFEVRGFGAGSFGTDELEEEEIDEGPVRRGVAAQVATRWRGEVVRPTLTLRYIDERFDPKVGFVRRRNIVEAAGEVQFQHRTSALGLEAVDVFVGGSQILSSDLETDLGRTASLSMDMSWVDGWFYSVGAEAYRDVVEEDFELVGRNVEAGNYDGVRVFSSISRSEARNPSFSVGYEGQASFFGGVRQAVNANFGFVATKYLRVRFTGGGNFIQLDGERFQTFTGSASVVIAPTTTLQLDGSMQINTAAQATVALLRLRWRYLPGSDLFIVYREERGYGESDELERRLILKATYRWDALL